MKKNIIVPFFLFFWLFPFLGNTQTIPTKLESTAYQAERILLHTDRALYISGEMVWFKIYALELDQNSLSSFSKVAYLELINQKRVSLSRVKIELVEGLGIGSIELPSILSTGNYILRSYTQAMRNLGVSTFGHKELIVINPKQALVQASEKEIINAAPKHKESATLEIAPERPVSISIETNKTQYAQRELITLEITTKDHLDQPIAAQLSLAVALANLNKPTKDSFFQSGKGEKLPNSPNPSKKSLFRMEADGLSVSGKVINTQTNEALPDAEVYLAFAGKTAMVYTSISDGAGNFHFLLPKLFGVQQIVLQALSKKTSDLKIVIDQAFHDIKVDTTTTALFQLNPEWIDYANNLMVNAQIAQTYQPFAPQPTYLAENKFAAPPFFGAPEKQYFLDDYTRFPLPEFFFEVVTKVRVKGNFGEEYLEVSNDWEGGMSNVKPLLLVDGVPIFDQAVFLKINNKLIKSTQIITEPFWLNPIVYNGIIQLSSFEGDARSFTLPKTAVRQSYLAFLPQKLFPMRDYTSTTDKHLPDFRNTLYWNPTIQTNSAGTASISFFTSDALGTYTIKVEGVAEKRMLRTSSATIQVVKNKIN